MTLHIGEITQSVAPGAHAVVLMDQAGRHMTEALTTPENISVVPLPHEPSGRALNGVRKSSDTDGLSLLLVTCPPRLPHS